MKKYISSIPFDREDEAKATKQAIKTTFMLSQVLLNDKISPNIKEGSFNMNRFIQV